MRTAASALAGLSEVSLKPKSADVKTRLVSSLAVIVLLVPAGASLTLPTPIANVCELVRMPSVACTVML